MAKAWSYWFPDLMPHVAGCPAPVAVFELRRAAQELFGRSRAWQVNQAPIAIAALQVSVTVVPDSADLELVRLENAWLDGKSLDVKQPEEMDSSFASDWQTHTGQTTTIVQLTPGTLMLYPKPLAAAVTGLKLRLSVRPSDAAASIPDEMAVAYRDDITAGAKAKLMLYPNVPWSSPDMAVLASGQFNAGASKANLKAARSFGQGRIGSRPKWC